MKQTVSTDGAAKGLGHYSQAVIWRDLVFVSGRVPPDPATNKLVDHSMAPQTEQVLENLKAVLAASAPRLTVCSRPRCT